MLDTYLEKIFTNFPHHIYRQGQSIARLSKDGQYYWGLWNGYNNFAEVYHLNGDRHETLSLDDINGWVNQQIFVDNGYTFLNLCEL